MMNRQRCSILHSQNGFTLLEIIVVFSLLAIVSGVGFFSFLNYSERQDLQQTTQNVVQDIEKARSDAVSSIKPQNCSGELSAYEIVMCVNGTCESSVDYEVHAICRGAREIVRSVKIGRGVSLNANETTCSTLFFSLPRGLVSGDTLPCVVVFESDGYKQTASISEWGNINISRIE